MTSQLLRFRCFFAAGSWGKDTKNGAAMTSLRSFLFRDDFSMINKYSSKIYITYISLLFLAWTCHSLQWWNWSKWDIFDCLWSLQPFFEFVKNCGLWSPETWAYFSGWNCKSITKSKASLDGWRRVSIYICLCSYFASPKRISLSNPVQRWIFITGTESVRLLSFYFGRPNY